MSKRLIITAVLIGILGLAFAGSALAAASTDTNAEEHEYCDGEMAGWHGGGMFGSDVISYLLGLTFEEIHQQRIDGQSLVEIAAARGVSQETLVEAILSEMTSTIQARVGDGILVQEQVDLMIQQMEQRIVEMVNRTTAGAYGEDGCAYGEMGYGGMMGADGMMGPGGMMGHGGMGMHGDHDDHDHDGNMWSGFGRGMMGWGKGMH